MTTVTHLGITFPSLTPVVIDKGLVPIQHITAVLYCPPESLPIIPVLDHQTPLDKTRTRHSNEWHQEINMIQLSEPTFACPTHRSRELCQRRFFFMLKEIYDSKHLMV